VATSAAEVPEGHPERGAGRYAVLEVSDQGAGMPPEVRDRLFEPFFTTRVQPLGGAPGRGLGLAVVHGIARQHGGFVEVESAPGRGSTFRVWFPAA
jgi:signal transduction histidine kinase